jgi:hypothetical protein
MSPLMWLLITWGGLTTLLIVVLIYRSALTRQEDQQLFLEESQSRMEREQLDLQRRVRQMNPLVRMLGAASGTLVLVIAGTWVYVSMAAQ